MRKKIEIKTGDKYGRLTIIQEITPHVHPNGQKRRKILCRCECGNETEVILNSLRSGNTTSCGCKNKEGTHTTHGLTNHPLYKVWKGMKSRCYNSKTKQYGDWGGRGITVCQEWVYDFKSFYDFAMANGWKKGLEIDRINNEGNYEPSNCRFVTRQENILNQRIKKNNTSGYRGVSYNKKTHKWRAALIENKRRHHIGYFFTAKEAAMAYNEYIIANNLPNKLNVI